MRAVWASKCCSFWSEGHIAPKHQIPNQYGILINIATQMSQTILYNGFTKLITLVWMSIRIIWNRLLGTVAMWFFKQPSSHQNKKPHNPHLILDAHCAVHSGNTFHLKYLKLLLGFFFTSLLIFYWTQAISWLCFYWTMPCFVHIIFWKTQTKRYSSCNHFVFSYHFPHVFCSHVKSNKEKILVQ